MSFSDWLLDDLRIPSTGPRHEPTNAWWRVMCLTGVDYFSTLGYQPGIAFLAAGVLSPFATLVLVLVTLGAALPVYTRVAEASPNGQGSIAMLQNLFPSWWGKIFVLVLLGFATTDFIITITLSAADGAAHLIHNPLAPHWLRSQEAVTLVILVALGAVFLKGFKEAVGIAFWLVSIYLVLNAIVTFVAMRQLLHHPEAFSNWKIALAQSGHSPLAIVGIALVLFPRLALGLSGFETGVAVMPLVKAHDEKARIRNTKRLLATAAIIMSLFLMATSVITTMLIPAAAFREGGDANGRAMAWLAHHYLGNGMGTAYDISTIAILGFAGASAMAGLLNLIPRYLPKFGMAPEWSRASRPLVLVFIGISILVTIVFHADVDAQGGAYATGVLVLITSASVAVFLAVKQKLLKIPFGLICIVFVYTTIANIIERPEGIRIASIFIGVMLVTSLSSRAWRSTEVRVSEVTLDAVAEELLAEDPDQLIRLIAHAPEEGDALECFNKADAAVRQAHNLDNCDCIYFFEVYRFDASDFSDALQVQGRRVGPHRVLSARSQSVPNAFAALLLELQRRTDKTPHAYFRWTELSPLANVIRFLFLGEGDAAPVTEEILRRAVRKSQDRPVVHVS